MFSGACRQLSGAKPRQRGVCIRRTGFAVGHSPWIKGAPCTVWRDGVRFYGQDSASHESKVTGGND